MERVDDRSVDVAALASRVRTTEKLGPFEAPLLFAFRRMVHQLVDEYGYPKLFV